jgi:hypothetical protein
MGFAVAVHPDAAQGCGPTGTRHAAHQTASAGASPGRGLGGRPVHPRVEQWSRGGSASIHGQSAGTPVASGT